MPSFEGTVSQLAGQLALFCYNGGRSKLLQKFLVEFMEISRGVKYVFCACSVIGNEVDCGLLGQIGRADSVNVAR